MSTEIVHYHYGQDSYRIQFEIAQLMDKAQASAVSRVIFRTSLIRIKSLGAGSPLKYFDYSRDFDTLADARLLTTEYAKSLVRHVYLKQRKKPKMNTQEP